MKHSTVLSARDLHFLLFDWLEVTSLTERERFADHSAETFEAVLELAETIATRDFAPHNRSSDLAEPRLVDGRVQLIPEVGAALAKFAEAGLLAAHADAAHGGLQLPTTVAKAAMAWFQAANVATSAYAFLSIANANLLLAHGTEAQIDCYARPLLDGRFFGTMCLSEPGAGSSLADLTTTAQPQPDGTFRLVGNKMWISAGDHELAENIVHLVLARTPGAPAGVRGISLFLAPKYLLDEQGRPGERNDIVTAGLNHKMGYRGTANAALNFGEGVHRPGGAAGAVGYLVGELGAGLRLMFHMMNEARIGVGIGAAALGYTGYLHSLDYARTRLQGRPATDRDPTRPQVPIIEHADVRRMLLAQKSYAEGGLALGLYCARLVDDCETAPDPAARSRAAELLDVLTPIAKSWPSQWCLRANDLAIQVLGGYGYTRDYPVEQFYRDNRLNPIHEGTHGIQAADLLGRKVVQADGAGLTALLDTARATSARAEAAGLGEEAADLGAALDALVAVTARLHGTGDLGRTLANASSYLEAFGHIVLAWIWLEQVLATQGRDGDFFDGKRAAARYFFRVELPHARTQLRFLDTLDNTILDTAPAWL